MADITNSSSSKNTLKIPNDSKTNSSMTNMLQPSNVQNLRKSGVGSATGNPRNKCALQPGHSLMDWIRLGNSGADLSGTRGRIIPVSSTELALHNKREDAWMVIRGKVYNVTRYMDFHPGGVDELMHGVGRDATKLFDEVHAWVNYTQLLQKCYIGPLVMKVHNNILDNALQLKAPLPPKAPIQSEIVPRFDWIQKLGDITFHIYTRPFCNPSAVLRRKSDTTLQLWIQIAHTTHKFHFKLPTSISWPPLLARIARETGKIEVSLAKTKAALWPSYGTYTLHKVDGGLEDEYEYEDFEVVTCQSINHDSYELSLQAKRELVYLPGVGYHVTFAAQIMGTISYIHFTFIPSQTTIPNKTMLIMAYKKFESSFN